MDEWRPSPGVPSSRRHRSARPQRGWQLLGGVGVLALLAVCGLGCFFILTDGRHAPGSRVAAKLPAPSTVPRDIDTRRVDPAPLSVQEVFPARDIPIRPEGKPYRVLRTEATDDCTRAVTGEIAGLLDRLGCSQVVRATLRSPTGAYLLTAGILNLDTVAGSDAAYNAIKGIVDGQSGRFLGMTAGKGTRAVTLSSAQAGWHGRGHYLAYCVIARTDGLVIGDDDDAARQVLADMVELHLRGGVLARRATLPLHTAVPPVQ